MLSNSPLRQFPGTPAASATAAFFRLGRPIVGGDADGTYFGINAPSGYAGDIANWQLNGTTGFRMTSTGIVCVGPVTGTPQFGFEVQGAVNDTNSGAIRVRNLVAGNAAAAIVQFVSDTAVAHIGCYSGSYTSASFADRFVLRCESTAAGMTFAAQFAGQDFRWLNPTIGEQMRLSETGQLSIGTVTASAKLHVLGTTDDEVGIFQPASGQTVNTFQIRDAGGTARISVGAMNDVSGSLLVMRAFSATQTGRMLSVRNSGDTERWGLAYDSANSLVYPICTTSDTGTVLQTRNSSASNVDQFQIVHSGENTVIQNVRGTVRVAQANSKAGLQVKTAATPGSNMPFSVLSNADAILFAIEPDGDIRTSQTSAGTSLGSVTNKLPIYNAAGTLVGYVPIYDAIT